MGGRGAHGWVHAGRMCARGKTRAREFAYRAALRPPTLQMLFTAGIEVTCFDAADMGGTAAPSKEPQLMVTLQHGWRGYEVRDFLLQQREVVLVEWDNIKTVPPRLLPSAAGDKSREARQSKKRRARKGKKSSGGQRGRQERGEL